MTDPSREKDNRIRGSKAHAQASVDAPPGSGSPASQTSNRSGTAEVASTDAPRQFTAAEVLSLLVDAIAQLETAGKVPLAAGVSARMRTMLPGFSVEQTEFGSFREITQAAEEAGLVAVTRTPNDFALRLVARPASPDLRGATLKTDLWRAIQDTDASVGYVYDRVTRRTARVAGTTTEHEVAVQTLSKEELLGLMREFAAAQHGSDATDLTSALEQTEGAQAFRLVTNRAEPLKRRWNRTLRGRVLEVAVSWATKNSIPLTHILETRDGKLAPSARVIPTTGREGMAIDAEVTAEGESELRREVLAILAAMPLHELLRLPIPLGHALKR
ncbi:MULTISPECIES: hypothetical protein [Microbacterium]|uniref:hypothetical protein n=1 Tax=Microbacterium TaxID=33882 RepID=UPI002780A2C2|nr:MULTISPECIES: hypothetical protein [Microbacterium]MDQ1082205.1 hypothetical protein [Microbacterium sp. SORGH_AS_0344]MDQ1169024.1 hypothetical protein [Microbacterium proteolyticum]